MTWSVRRFFEKFSEFLGKLCLTTFCGDMCDKIKNEQCWNMARFKGYSMKIPKI